MTMDTTKREEKGNNSNNATDRIAREGLWLHDQRKRANRGG